MPLIAFWFVTIFPQLIAIEQFPQLVVWNVGQGLWATYMDSNTCTHFDIGGEFFNAEKISRSCGKKKNFLFISHNHQDHINFKYRSRLRFTEKMPNLLAAKITPLYFPTAKRGNASSKVWRLANQVVFPGDSLSRQFQHWQHRLTGKENILILPHHGSRNELKLKMLNAFPNLKVAIASARKKKYGHPHKEVEFLLKKKRIPLLSTEVWGNLIFKF